MQMFGIKMVLFLFYLTAAAVRTAKRNINDKIQSLDPRRIFLPGRIHVHPTLPPMIIAKPIDFNHDGTTSPKGPVAPTVKRPIQYPTKPTPSGTSKMLIVITALFIFSFITGAILYLCWRCTSKKACQEIDSQTDSIDLKTHHDEEIQNSEKEKI